jgi:hypothetical protein
VHIDTPEPSTDEMALRTIIYLDGDMITMATTAGLARADQHWATVTRTIADFTPLPTLLVNLVPIIIIGSVIWSSMGFVSRDALSHDTWHFLLAQDVLYSLVLPTVLLWLISKGGSYWLQRKVNEP